MDRTEETTCAEAGTIAVVSLIELVDAAEHNGPAWSQSTDDLNVNLVVLTTGNSIAEHVNGEVDVLLVGVEGSGHITIDGQATALAAGQLIIVPKDVPRSITPTGARFAYLTCHKRRARLWPIVDR